ncbi:hypothetical protein QBC39DRAFT_124003 [Podospora conica]|nr:hypothetical protein QBC39DRAFT_124003 [Schizothecium conicum]
MDSGRGARLVSPKRPAMSRKQHKERVGSGERGARRANCPHSKANKRNCPAPSRSVRHDGHPVCAGCSHHGAARPKHAGRLWEALAPQADAINMSTGSWCGWGMGCAGTLSAALCCRRLRVPTGIQTEQMTVLSFLGPELQPPACLGFPQACALCARGPRSSIDSRRSSHAVVSMTSTNWVLQRSAVSNTVELAGIFGVIWAQSSRATTQPSSPLSRIAAPPVDSDVLILCPGAKQILLRSPSDQPDCHPSCQKTAMGATSRVQSFGSDSRQRSGPVTHFPWWAARCEVPKSRPLAYHRRLACSQNSTAKSFGRILVGGVRMVEILAMVAPGVLSKRRG